MRACFCCRRFVTHLYGVHLDSNAPLCLSFAEPGAGCGRCFACWFSARTVPGNARVCVFQRMLGVMFSMSRISDTLSAVVSWLAGLGVLVLMVFSPWLVSFVAFKADTHQTVAATVVEKSQDMDGVAYAVAEIPSVSGSKQVLVPGKFVPGDVTQVAVDAKGDLVEFNWLLPAIVSMVLLFAAVPVVSSTVEALNDKFDEKYYYSSSSRW